MSWAKLGQNLYKVVFECMKLNHCEHFFTFFFQLLTCYHPGKSQYSTALRVINQPKNRSPDLLSTDSARVFLNPGGEIDGDDYINASWLTGKLFLQGFINCSLF